MTDYPYDPDLPYVVVTEGNELEARFRHESEADFYAGSHTSLRVIDTTPKPRIPEDAEHIVWRHPDAPTRRMYAEKQNGLWFYDSFLPGRSVEDLPGVTPETVFMVLEERKS